MAGIPFEELNTKYCKKHNQRYARYLQTCPVCVGEALADLPKIPLGPCTIDESLIPNKVPRYSSDQVYQVKEEEKPARPVQLLLF